MSRWARLTMQAIRSGLRPGTTKPHATAAPRPSDGSPTAAGAIGHCGQRTHAPLVATSLPALTRYQVRRRRTRSSALTGSAPKNSFILTAHTR
jgi:hypothetical protein